MKRKDGLAAARAFRDNLVQQGIPVQRVFLFGSVAQGTASDDSDIDVAVVCTPFLHDRMEEQFALWRARRDVDIGIEPLCLHPEDFSQPLSIAQEIERTGVEV